MAGTMARCAGLVLLLGSLTLAAGGDASSCEDVGGDDSHFDCRDPGAVRCQRGWTGEDCDRPSCDPTCVHGSCISPGVCKCMPGWQGERCDECQPLPGCQHGSCNGTGFECVCEEGWDGLLCSQPKCRAGCHPTRGFCEEPGECKCRLGWGGDNCDECQPIEGCQHGSCSGPLECRCDPGWSGVYCDKPICAPGCNPNFGSCEKPGECRCEVGWWGERCETCFPYPGCQHGYCTRPWECLCEPGWAGMMCERRTDETFCSQNPNACLNGGTCIDVPGSRNYTCSCPSLFTGQRCDFLADQPPALRTITEDPELVQVVTADSSSPTGSYSILDPLSELRSSRTLSKDERRILLQNQARITFRQPKIISTADKDGKLPFTVIERKLVPLPIFLPRVSEIIPGEDMPTRMLKPKPILVSRNDKENMLVNKSGDEEEVASSPDVNTLDENRRFIRHQLGGPDPVQLIEDIRDFQATPSPSPAPRLTPNPIPSPPSNNPRGPNPTPSSLNSAPSFIRGTSDVATNSTREPQSPNPPRTPIKVVRTRTRPLVVNGQPSTLPRPNPVTPASHPPAPISVPQQRSVTAAQSPVISVRQGIALEEGLGDTERLRTYYEQNSNGRVHIGDVSEVDDGAPHDEIYDAFIELKKV